MRGLKLSHGLSSLLLESGTDAWSSHAVTACVEEFYFSASCFLELDLVVHRHQRLPVIITVFTEKKPPDRQPIRVYDRQQ